MIRRITKGALFAGAVAMGASFGLQPNTANASEPFIGQIQYFGFNFAPRGWASCNGAILPISQNTALFSLLGTIYGGDGETTFGIPDMRGRVPIHFGQGPGLSPRTIGNKNGRETVMLTTNQIPSHNHPLQGSASPATAVSPAGGVSANMGRVRGYNTVPNVAMHSGAIGNTGGGAAHNNMPPFLVVNCTIALQGVFPSPT